jgi:hypothetical protein
LRATGRRSSSWCAAVSPGSEAERGRNRFSELWSFRFPLPVATAGEGRIGTASWRAQSLANPRDPALRTGGVPKPTSFVQQSRLKCPAAPGGHGDTLRIHCRPGDCERASASTASAVAAAAIGHTAVVASPVTGRRQTTGSLIHNLRAVNSRLPTIRNKDTTDVSRFWSAEHSHLPGSAKIRQCRRSTVLMPKTAAVTKGLRRTKVRFSDADTCRRSRRQPFFPSSRSRSAVFNTLP